ncbi:MAG: hypothetical protein ACPLW9_01010 [Minisyncoccales bacterium]
MGKSPLKKSWIKLPKIIIVEGFWQIGKTTLINYLAKKFNYTVIVEPDHIVSGIKKNISKWYRKKHGERYKEAIAQLNRGKRIVMERSIISSIAFNYAKTRKLPLGFRKDLEDIQKLKNSLIIFLYTNRKFITKSVLTLKDNSVKKQILDNPKFYQNYLYFYKKVLPSLIKHKIMFKKVNKGWKFQDLKEIL